METTDAILIIESADSTSNQSIFDKASAALRLCLRDVPASSRFRDFIWGYNNRTRDSFRHHDSIEAAQRAIANFEEFRVAREALVGLARLNKLAPGQAREFHKFIWSLNDRFVAWILDAEGWQRVRECEVESCGKVYWAGRQDARACSSKCARVLRNRRYQQNYQLKYKHRRAGKAPLTTRERQILQTKKLEARHEKPRAETYKRKVGK